MFAKDIKNNDEEVFKRVCESERHFHTSGQMGIMLRMKNRMDRTVGDGTLSTRDFSEIMKRIARKAGSEGSQEYRAKMSDLEKTYQEAIGDNY